MKKQNQTFKIAACLVFLAIQAAAMILFSFGGCTVPVRDDKKAEEDTPDALTSAGDADPAPDSFSPAQTEQKERASLQCLYADAVKEESFARAAGQDARYADSGAVLLPHYANALGMCCELLSSIEREIELVVLIGPNHHALGSAVQISGADWYWGTGQMSGDLDAAQTLAAAAGTLTDEQVAQEWSIQTLIPYMRRYFPQARLVTVLVSRGTQPRSLAALAEAIGELSGQQELLLAGSVDFSHDLDPASARENDEKTCALIETGDIPALLQLDNGYLDSPETAALVLQYTQAKGRTLKQCSGLFERFWENGQEKAGSYYTFAAWQEP